MENRRIALDLIDINQGQIPGVGRNPRCWTYDDIERLKKSIEETPELLEARGILVYPFNGRFVAIGGNMRLSALKSMGVGNAPCMVLPEEVTPEVLCELVIKDNGEFGDWDAELLKTEWADCPKEEWGINVFEESDAQEEKLPTQKLDDDRKVLEVKFEADEFSFVQDRLRMINDVPEQALLKLLGYGGAEE